MDGIKLEITDNRTGRVQYVGVEEIPALFPNQEAKQVFDLLSQGVVMFPERAPALRSPVNFGGLFSKVFR